MERVTGIEPVYPAWKAGALADVLYPHVGACAPGKELKGNESLSLTFYIYYNINFLKSQIIFFYTISDILAKLLLWCEKAHCGTFAIYTMLEYADDKRPQK